MSRTFPQIPPTSPSNSKPPAPILTNLPYELLRRIMLFTMSAQPPRPDQHDEHCTEIFLNASNSEPLNNAISLAFTCKLLYSVFQDSLTGVKLVSSWQTEQNTLIAACKIAAKNLRAVHVECSAPVTAALKEVVSLRPPVRHFVLIGVNISKILMADIVYYVGQSLQKLVISAAPSLDCTVVDLIADRCPILKYIELGGSRHVQADSLIRLFQTIGPSLLGIELNSLQHQSLCENVLFALAQYSHRLNYVRFLKLRWITDQGLERLFTLRAHQLTELRLISCRKLSVHSLSVLSAHAKALEKLSFSFDKGECISTHRPSPRCPFPWEEAGDSCFQDGNPCLSIGEIALVQLSRKCPNLTHFTLADPTISDHAMTRLSKACGKSLAVLNIRHCSSLGNQSLRGLAMYASTLTSLDISYLPLIDDSGLQILLEAMQHSLQELQIIGCTRLTDAAIKDIVPRFGKTLRVIRLSYCNFSISAVNTLKDSLPRVTLCGASKCSVQ